MERLTYSNAPPPSTAPSSSNTGPTQLPFLPPMPLPPPPPFYFPQQPPIFSNPNSAMFPPMPFPPPPLMYPHPLNYPPPFPQTNANHNQPNKVSSPEDLKAIEDYIVSLIKQPKQQINENEETKQEEDKSEKNEEATSSQSHERKTPTKDTQWRRKYSTDSTETQTTKTVPSTPERTKEEPAGSQTLPSPHSPAALRVPSKKIVNITEEAISLFHSLNPHNGEFNRRLKLLATLQKFVHNTWPESSATLHLFGSSANDFGFKSADMDICLMIDESCGTQQKIVQTLGDVLRRKQMKKVKVLPRARVPIVKFHDPISNFSCDICINNHLALKNTKLISDYAKIDIRARQLGYVVKYWAKQRQINEPYQGTLSSYAYILMVIHFLQLRQPPILPCLQEKFPDEERVPDMVDGFDCSYYHNIDELRDFGEKNTETLGELIHYFFRLYSSEFDWENSVISVRTGRYLTKAEKQWESRSSESRDYFLFALEDPFEVTHNLGRLVDEPNLKIIKNEFKRAYRLVCKNKPLSVICAPYQSNEEENNNKNK